jgi:hypothetical protein
MSIGSNRHLLLRQRVLCVSVSYFRRCKRVEEPSLIFPGCTHLECTLSANEERDPQYIQKDSGGSAAPACHVSV